MLFSFFNNFPEFIREYISPLVQFLFSLIIFPQIRIFITELVEMQYKIIKNSLLSICIMKVIQEFLLNVRAYGNNLFPVQSKVFENLLHLTFVINAKFFPELNNYRFEIVVNTFTICHCMLCCN